MPSLDAKRLTLNAKSGFTLIELLIVITIIGILATLILASFGAAQAKARDGRRKSDLAQVKRGMELAKSDCKGAADYPWLGTSGGDPVPEVNAYINLDNYLTDENLKYMGSKTSDPVDRDEHKYAYGANSDGSPVPDKERCPPPTGNLYIDGFADYAIWTKLERISDADSVVSRDVCFDKPTPGGAGKWTDNDYKGYYVVCNN